MASEPIRSTSVVAAPKDYSIPNAQQIRLLSVTASFTDNGAGGDWLPAVVILDNNGNALVRAVDQAVKVTAGNDAEVSWFPGVKNTTATAPVSTGLAVAYVSKQNVTLGPGTTQPTWDQFHTNDATVFSWNAGDHRFVNCTTPGQFMVGIGANWLLPPVTITSPVSASTSGFDSIFDLLDGIVGFCFDIEDATVADPKEVGSVSGWDLVPAHGYSPPLTFFTSITLGAAQTFGGVSMMIVRLATV